MVEKKLPRSAEVKRLCIDPNHKHLSDRTPSEVYAEG